MDGSFQAFDPAVHGVTLGDRLDRLAGLEAVFGKLAGEFPANLHLARQHEAICRAKDILHRVADAKGLFATDYQADLAEVAAVFEDLGARAADLEGMQLA